MTGLGWRMGWWGLLALALPGVAPAAPLRVLVMGDSLSEEYAFELPFSAPASDPFSANTSNWPEILAARRAAELSFGSYESSVLFYPDLRNGGFKFNYGIPSFRTTHWLGVIQSTFFDTFSSDPLVKFYYPTRLALERHLAEVDVAVIFLGGNDLKSNYTGIFLDAEPPALLAQTVANLTTLHDYVRARAPGLPIVIATAPDVGATPEVAGKYTDPAGRAIARARIAAMNEGIAAMAASRGATVARVDHLTDRVFDDHPLHLNGTGFSLVPDPQNPPHAAFCRDGFHPATMAQALVADILAEALGRATGRAIPRLANREILGDVLGLDPDQPYLDWAGAAGDFHADPDGDGLPNLAEYALGTPPTAAGWPFVFATDGALAFPISAAGSRFASITVEETPDLTDWQPVPADRLGTSPEGFQQVLPAPAATRRFYRIGAAPRP